MPEFLDSDKSHRGSLEPMAGRCGKQLYGTGDRADEPSEENPARYCTAPKLKDGRYCIFHARKNSGFKRGIENPSFSTGFYSSALPESIVEKYEEVLASGDLLTLQDEIAVAKALTARAMQRLQRGDSLGSKALASARTTAKRWEDMEAAINGGNADNFNRARSKMRAAITELEDVVKKSNRERAASREFREMVIALERMVRSENTRTIENRQQISIEKALALQAAVAELVSRALDEFIADVALQNAVRRRVASGLSDLIGRRNDQKALAGGGPDGIPSSDSPAGDGGGASRLLSPDTGGDVSEDKGLPEP